MSNKDFAGDLTPLELIKIEIYRKNPVLFVERELGEVPSEYQKEVLMACADLSNKAIIISAGRGSGKTLMVSWIVAWSAACLQDFYPKYESVILGGSLDQSIIMYGYFKIYMYKTPLLYKRLVGDSTARGTILDNGYVRAVPCSDNAVRGRHPELLILDEVAGADDDVVLSALPMVLGSNHGRVIMLSTPHRSFGLFQDYWENFELYQYKRFGPWELTKVPWIDQDYVERCRMSYPPAKFAVEFLGKFPQLGENVFPRDYIMRAVEKEPFKWKPGYQTDAGVDWGQNNPTVLTPCQSIKGKFYVPGPMFEWTQLPYGVICKEVSRNCKNYRIDEVFCDASNPGEIERLQEFGINADGVNFSTEKKLMIENLQMLFHMNRIRISPDQETLIKQLLKYRWRVPKRGATKDTISRKKDEDHVDALMLSLYSLVESGWLQSQQESFSLT